MSEVISFEEAIGRATGTPTLVVGNGFSVSLFPKIFRYGSLLEQADFKDLRFAKRLFEISKTSNFEEVIRNLDFAYKAANLLAGRRKNSIIFRRITETILRYRDGLREALVQAVAQNHPERPVSITDEQVLSCRTFLRKFEKIYSVNYDLLLYWVIMRNEIDPHKVPSGDGFSSYGHDETDPYVYWEPETSKSVSINFLHGALHLFDGGHEIYKYTWSRTQIALIDQVRDALGRDRYPIFVSEGSSDEKLNRIMHNAYLSKVYRSYVNTVQQPGRSIFVFGHSLDEYDSHIISKISEGRAPQLFVSVKAGAPDAEEIVRRSGALREARRARHPLEVVFYDADSARIWG